MTRDESGAAPVSLSSNRTSGEESVVVGTSLVLGFDVEVARTLERRSKARLAVCSGRTGAMSGIGARGENGRSMDRCLETIGGNGGS